MLRDRSYLSDRIRAARYAPCHAQPCCPPDRSPAGRPAPPTPGQAVNILDVYVGAFLASLVAIGVLGWLLLWPSQR